MGVWGFNPEYLMGIYVFSLPLEEILFFICIPYACIFTYEAVGFFSKGDPLKKYEGNITLLLIIGLVAVGLISLGKWYTSVTFLLCAGYLAYLHLKKKPTYLAKFYLSFLFILIPFFIVNGILTGTGIPGEIVWYDNAENLGIRMATIPVEDTFYGMLLLLMNVVIFETLQEKERQISNP